MALPMMFFLAQTETNKWSKRFFWFLFLSTIPAIFFTYSRGALLGLMAIMGLMLLQSKQRLVLVPVLAAALMVAVLFTPDAWRQRMSFASGEGTAMDQSAYSRINAWTFAWRLVGDYPVTGGGFKTFTVDLFKRYAPNASDVHGPHSVYFGVLGEHGWVGLFLYMTLVGSCFLTVRRVIKWAKQCGDEVSANYARMFQFSLIGFLVSGLFLGRAYFDFYYSIVACLVILKHLTRLKWREARSAALNAEAQVVAPVSVAEGSVAY
jgi:probable O-glycosylation ligase (exosortase A-associated)